MKSSNLFDSKNDGAGSGLNCDCIGGGPAPHICCACDFRIIKNSKLLTLGSDFRAKTMTSRMEARWAYILKNYVLEHGARSDGRFFKLVYDGEVFEDVYLYNVLRAALLHALQNYR